DPAELRQQRDPEEYVERLEALVRESIGLRMMSDVPYGAFLSGGVDSSLNVALMADLADRPVSTFSVAIEGDVASDELGFARAIARLGQNLLSLDRADVVQRAADSAELFWGGAVPFYDTHKRLLLRHDLLSTDSARSAGRRAVDALYADVDAHTPGASQLERM